MPPSNTPSTSMAMRLALLAAGGLVLWILWPVLLPFALAAVVAYVVYPLHQALVRWHVRPSLAAVVSLTLAALVALGVLLLVVPVIGKQLPLLREQVPQWLAQAQALAGPWLASWGLTLDTVALQQAAREALSGRETDVLQWLWRSLQVGGNVLLGWVGYAVLTPVAAVFLLLDGPRWISQVGALLPATWRPAWQAWLRDSHDLLGQFLSGQWRVMVALAVFYSVALRLVGLELAVAIGVFTGLAVFVPYLGFGLGLALGLAAAGLQFGQWLPVIGVALVFAAGQLLESFWLTPRWVGERIGFHPLGVLLAVLVAGHWLGVVGVLVALPATALLGVALGHAWRFWQAEPGDHA
ncbi:MAG: AI-2E family transporter [Burkholderiaceae bacterium]|jgi:predicted PurR-regulated permease PerM